MEIKKEITAGMPTAAIRAAGKGKMVTPHNLPGKIQVMEMHFSGKSFFRLDRYAMLVMLEGGCKAEAGREEFRFQQGNVLLLQPETDLFLDAEDAESVIFLGISFTRQAFEDNCRAVLEGCPVLSGFFGQDQRLRNMDYLRFEGMEEETRALCLRMRKEFCGQKAYWEPALLSSLMILLIRLSRECFVHASPVQTGDPVFSAFYSYLSAHSDTATLEETASHFSCHPNTVSAVLKRNTGLGFKELRTQMRMERAAKLMRSGLTAIEAAHICGYSNMSNFYAHFEARFGKKPGEYIREL